MGIEHPIIVIADDVTFNRTLIKMCLRGHRYQCLEADNGYGVLERVQTHQVDLVILDLMMPMLDGFGCLAEIKAHDRYRRIPIIINSSLEDMASIEKALELGCYDYFIKSLPQNELQILLPLKAKNAIAAKRLLDQISEQKHLLENEIRAAGKYQRFLLPQNILATGLSVRPSYHPYLDVGGDFFDFIPLSEDRTAFFIADVCGHGVLAAMVAALLKPLFERYILETASPAQTLARLNQDFLRLTDDTKYITAFVAIYDPGRHTLCYANAGHPPPLYLRRATGAIELLKATGTFLGVFQDDEWASSETSIPVMACDRLLLVTDGVLEATSPNGAMFGLEGLCHLVQDLAGADLTAMTEQLWQYLQVFADNRFHDDVTFITIDFHHLQVSRVTRIASDPTQVLPIVDDLVAALRQDCSAQDIHAIKVSLVEMLMNAIEHGNLGIGYARKQEALATGTFDQLVDRRMQQEPHASRSVTIAATITSTYVVFTIQDEGVGFDWQAVRSDHASDLHGRGLLIARTYMDHCIFQQHGNTVTLVKYLSSLLPAAHAARSDRRDCSFTPITMARKDKDLQTSSQVVDDVTLLTLSGAINFTARKTLGTLVDADLAQGRRHFVIDLYNVTFIDSSGLGALVACFTTIRKQGGRLKLVQLPEQVRALLEVTKLVDFFDLCDSTEEALQSVRL